MGSGSVGLASLRLGRRFVGIELIEKYFKLASRSLYHEIDTNLFDLLA